MLHPQWKFLRSVSLMVGAMVGVGVFGMPYVFAQAGAAYAMLSLFLLGAVMLVLHLMFAEVVIQTPGIHRLPAYLGLYLGERARLIGVCALSFGIWGAMLAYMSVGGTFLQALVPQATIFPDWIFPLLMWAFAGTLVFHGLGFASKIEGIVLLVIVFLFLFIILLCIPFITTNNLMSFSSEHFFAPYGVILFALAGSAIIPEMKEVLGKKAKRLLGPAVACAVVGSITLYALFSIAVVGVTGSQTTPLAFVGLTQQFGLLFSVVTSLLGLLTILSIFMILGVELMDTFQLDWHMKKSHAWLLVCGVPLVLFGFGAREFLPVIGFVGGVFSGFISLLIALCYWRMRKSPVCVKKHCLNFPAPLTWIIIFIFASGILVNLI